VKHYAELIRHPGNEGLFWALECSLIATLRGQSLHVHVQGLRGTGKTTIIRAAGHLRPLITRVRGCPYNCHPQRPHCPLHKDLPVPELQALGTEQVPMPFLEISHSAKLGTVVGSIDLAKLTQAEGAVAAILPGTLPRAHRGVVFIDEINRLADTAPELTDVLLDLMGTKPGRVQIEETGLPIVELPVQVSVWAASNPDEDPGPLGEVRRQLCDRFDYTVDVQRPAEPAAVRSIIAPAQMESGDDRVAFLKAKAQSEWPAVAGEIWEALAHFYVEEGLESLRGLEAITAGACLAALYEGRTQVLVDDIVRVAPFALSHRTEVNGLAKALQRMQACVAGVAFPAEQEPQAKPRPMAIPRPESSVNKPNWDKPLPTIPPFGRGLLAGLTRLFVPPRPGPAGPSTIPDERYSFPKCSQTMPGVDSNGGGEETPLPRSPLTAACPLQELDPEEVVQSAEELARKRKG
jgi:magnesium chelatase subunit I